MRDSSPLVSAVIPVYNGERFVADAIRSVLEQTYQAVECVVVDDGSTDGTVETVRFFGRDVRLVQVQNGGQSRARNIGVSAARGAYVAFLDADDIWLEQKIESQMELFKAKPHLGLVYGGYSIVDEGLKPIRVVGIPEAPHALRSIATLEHPGIAFALTGVIPADVYQEIGGYDERLSVSGDRDFLCRVLLRYEGDGVPQPVALYRQHEEQAHLNVAIRESDLSLVFAKLFDRQDLPSTLRRTRRRTYAKLYLVLGAGYIAQGDISSSARCLLRSIYHHPAPLAAAAGDRLRRAVRTLARETSALD